MLKFFIGLLLLANCTLFAYNAGYLGSAGSDGREPGRSANQLNAELIRLVDPFARLSPAASGVLLASAVPGPDDNARPGPTLAQAPADGALRSAGPSPASGLSPDSGAAPAGSASSGGVASPAGAASPGGGSLSGAVSSNSSAPSAAGIASPAGVTTSAAPSSSRGVGAGVSSGASAGAASAASSATVFSRQCIEIGNFDAAETRRFERQVAPLALGERLSRHSLTEPARYIVYIPPLADKDGAERKAAELRRLGVNDFYVLSGNSDLRWGISLGMFKSEEAARAHLATLVAKGVHSARVAARPSTAGRTAFQLRGLDATAEEAIGRIRQGFPRQEVRACAPA